VFWLKDKMEEYEIMFSDIAAMKANGKTNLIYWHNNGNGDHWHVQVRRGL
jgi:hypothetical protein